MLFLLVHHCLQTAQCKQRMAIRSIRIIYKGTLNDNVNTDCRHNNKIQNKNSIYIGTENITLPDSMFPNDAFGQIKVSQLNI